MGSDIARNTYDETKQYRRVVAQQGRVILEADLNEASEIATEAMRHETLDVVGPAGVPSDPVGHADGTGYAITAPVATTRELSIGAGVIYAGGWRVVQADPALRFTTQTDWLDRSVASISSAAAESIYLRLREHEISVAEDAALREVALGGPQTAQRVRLVRRVERAPVKSTTCSAFAEVIASWKSLGLVFDAADGSLVPTARLVVGQQPLGSAPGPCDPAAKDGYLGAENQLIRVQIASATQLLWGYDNASSLYRVDLDATDTTHRTVALRQAPVDAFHQPRVGQVVELLRAAVGLGGDDYAAASTGFVTTLASAYRPDGAKLVLTDALPAEFLDPAQTKAVFVRVWENRAAFTAGTPQPLIDQAGNQTGLQVTLTAPPFVAGTFWCFAVRPTTPQAIYPARYTAPQPPEGPREWVCALAAIDWTKTPPAVTDCRPKFDNLVTLTGELVRDHNTGCCTVTVGPEDLTGARTLQTVVDEHRAALRIGSRVTICLRPGDYELRAPLRLGPDHSGLAIEGGHGGAVIRAAQGTEQAFLDGLVVVVHANEVTLRGLRFHLPEVPFARAVGRLADLPYARIGSEGVELQQLSASIAIRPVHAAELTIEDCLFRFSLASQQPVFGAAIFAGSECWGLRILGNKFVMEEGYLRHEPDLARLLFGYILAPTITATLGPVTTGPLRGAVTGGGYVRPLLTEAQIRGNLFSGLVAATMIVGDSGAIRIEDNRVRDSYAGFWLLAVASLFDDSATPRNNGVDEVAFQQDPIVQSSLIIAIGYPAPAGLVPRDIQHVTIAAAAIPHTRGLAHFAPRAVPGPAEPAPPPAATGTPAGAAKQPDAVTAQIAISEELALAIRFAAPAKQGFLSLNQTVAPVLGTVLQRAFIDDKRQVQKLALHVADNDIDVRVSGIASGAGLVIWHDEREPQGSVTMTANRIANASIAQATALILRARRIAITGNLLNNDTSALRSDAQLRVLLAQLATRDRARTTDTKLARVSDIVLERWCLIAVPAPGVVPPTGGPAVALAAITGNVLEGLIDLPVRSPPLLAWDAFNTQA